MKILLIGANGQLGSDLTKAISAKGDANGGLTLIPVTHAELEITDHAATKALIEQHQPDIVLNTTAFHKVDLCEDEVARSFAVNADAVRNLAQIAAAADITLVHLSTDYVFGGDKNARQPLTETSLPAPLNVYGVSKLAGEYFIRATCPKHFIVRSSGLYGVAGSSGKGGNFIELMLRLAREGKDIKVVDDQVLTPTYTVDLARKIVELMQTPHYGLYHITSDGQCSWYEFARAIFELSGLTPNLQPTTTATFGAKATRPPYSVLENAALKAVQMDDLRSWRDALAAYLAEKQAN